MYSLERNKTTTIFIYHFEDPRVGNPCFISLFSKFYPKLMVQIYPFFPNEPKNHLSHHYKNITTSIFTIRHWLYPGAIYVDFLGNNHINKIDYCTKFHQDILSIDIIHIDSYSSTNKPTISYSIVQYPWITSILIFWW